MSPGSGRTDAYRRRRDVMDVTEYADADDEQRRSRQGAGKDVRR